MGKIYTKLCLSKPGGLRMTERILTQQHLIDFRDYLLREEKSAVTVEKYLRDARTFFSYAEVQPVTKELTVAYKRYLEERKP